MSFAPLSSQSNTPFLELKQLICEGSRLLSGELKQTPGKNLPLKITTLILRYNQASANPPVWSLRMTGVNTNHGVIPTEVEVSPIHTLPPQHNSTSAGFCLSSNFANYTNFCFSLTKNFGWKTKNNLAYKSSSDLKSGDDL